MNQRDGGRAMGPFGEAGKSGLRVAFFGGSFDPPHLGHLAVARAARTALRLDTVLFAPVAVQPLKADGVSASFEQRLAMTRLAIEGEPCLAISLADAPKPKGGPNFTLETLVGLRKALGPGCRLYCLMGADSFFGLRRWHRATEVPFAAPLIVAWRPGEPLEGLQDALPEGLTLEAATGRDETVGGVEVREFAVTNKIGDHAPFYVLPGLDVEISASEIRSRIRAERSGAEAGSDGKRALVPDAVAEYVRTHELYR